MGLGQPLSLENGNSVSLECRTDYLRGPCDLLEDRVFELAKNVDRLKEKNIRFYRTNVLKNDLYSICLRILIPRNEDSGSFVS